MALLKGATCSSLVSTAQIVNQGNFVASCSEIVGKSSRFELEVAHERFTKTFPECVFVALSLAEFNPKNLLFPVVPPIMNGAHFNRLKSFFGGRYCVEKALMRTLFGRTLLRNLAEKSSEPGVEIFMHNDASFFYLPAYDQQSSPVWPKGVHGSITHSPLYAACLLSKSSDAVCLGIDCESILTMKRARNIESRIASSNEVELVVGLLEDQAKFRCNDEGDRLGMAVTLLFSAKEAIYKAYHSRVQDFFGFSAYEATSCSESSLVFKCTADFGRRLSIEKVEVQYFFTASSVWCAVFHKP